MAHEKGTMKLLGHLHIVAPLLANTPLCGPLGGSVLYSCEETESREDRKEKLMIIKSTRNDSSEYGASHLLSHLLF